jgi:hypothetical protein
MQWGVQNAHYGTTDWHEELQHRMLVGRGDSATGMAVGRDGALRQHSRAGLQSAEV